MKLSSDCMFCLVSRQWDTIGKYEDEGKKTQYLRAVLKIVADAGEGATAPAVVAKINRLHRETFGAPYSFEELKAEYDGLLLTREEEISARIDAAEDSLLAAVRFAIAGNYIDFGTMNRIDNGKLRQLLETAGDQKVDPAAYGAFRLDLAAAGSLVFLTDNCGEIVLDKLLIETIRRQFPVLRITVISRGLPVVNDATAEDAARVGMDSVAEVIGNGTEIAGTQLDAISPEALERIRSADVIISKGQGNFETLHGCGLNVYYLFLCKCAYFERRFRMERFKGVFVNERNLGEAMEGR